MKKFDEFISEGIRLGDKDINGAQLLGLMDRYARLLKEYIVNKIEEKHPDLVHEKKSGWHGYGFRDNETHAIRIYLRMSLNTFDSFRDSESTTKILDDFSQNLKDLKEIIDSLSLEHTVKSMGDSFQVWIEIKNTYFRENEDFLISLDTTNKYNV